MSDNLKRYRAIRDAIMQLYPTVPTGNQARHLTTLAALIRGMVGSRQTQLPALASKWPEHPKRARRIKRFRRWLTNPRVTPELYFLPFASALIQRLAHGPLVLVIDGSPIARGCITLVVSLVYQGRALPIAWVVTPGRKGHFSEETHRQLVQQVHASMPPEATVIFLGDGEFDGPGLQAVLTSVGWSYVCRTAKNTQLRSAGEWLTLADVYLRPGQAGGLPDVQLTGHAYGPVLVIAWWARRQAAPLSLVTNVELVAAARCWYRTRFRIETFFADQTGRGFHLHRSHLADPARRARLLLAAGLTYIWSVYLGVVAHRDAWMSVIHRTDRCDWSLFQLGLARLDQLLNEDLPIPVALRLLALQPI
jgi:hypothetical protein